MHTEHLATLDLTLYDASAPHKKSFSYYYFNYVMLQKFAGPLVGAPVRPNMLNMPKSASVNTALLRGWRKKLAVSQNDAR